MSQYRDGARTAATAACLTLALIQTSMAGATESSAPCRTTIEVRSCGGEGKPDVDIAVHLRAGSASGESAEPTSTPLRTSTDDRGQAHIRVCSDRVERVDVFLIEDAPPIQSEPVFEQDDQHAHQAHGVIVVC